MNKFILKTLAANAYEPTESEGILWPLFSAQLF